MFLINFLNLRKWKLDEEMRPCLWSGWVFGIVGAFFGLSLFFLMVGAVSVSLERIMVPKESAVTLHMMADSFEYYRSHRFLFLGLQSVVMFFAFTYLVHLANPRSEWRDLWWPPRRGLSMLGLCGAYGILGCALPLGVSGKGFGGFMGGTSFSDTLSFAQEVLFLTLTSWVFLILLSGWGVMGWLFEKSPVTVKKIIHLGGQAVLMGIGCELIGRAAFLPLGTLFQGGFFALEAGGPESFLLLLYLYLLAFGAGGMVWGIFLSATINPELSGSTRIMRTMLAAWGVGGILMAGYPAWKMYQGPLQTQEYIKKIFREADLEPIPVVVGGQGSQATIVRPAFYSRYKEGQRNVPGIYRKETLLAAQNYIAQHEYLNLSIGNPMWWAEENRLKAFFDLNALREFYFNSPALIHRMLGMAVLGKASASPANRRLAAQLWNPQKFYYGNIFFGRLAGLYGHLGMKEQWAITERQFRQSIVTADANERGGVEKKIPQPTLMDHGVIRGRVEADGRVIKVVLFSVKEKTWPSGDQRKIPSSHPIKIKGDMKEPLRPNDRTRWENMYRVSQACEALTPHADGSFEFEYLQEGSYYLAVVFDPTGFPGKEEEISVRFPSAVLTLSPSRPLYTVPGISIRFKKEH